MKENITVNGEGYYDKFSYPVAMVTYSTILGAQFNVPSSFRFVNHM
jgi:hypothetical protein